MRKTPSDFPVVFYNQSRVTSLVILVVRAVFGPLKFSGSHSQQSSVLTMLLLVYLVKKKKKTERFSRNRRVLSLQLVDRCV